MTVRKWAAAGGWAALVVLAAAAVYRAGVRAGEARMAALANEARLFRTAPEAGAVLRGTDPLAFTFADAMVERADTPAADGTLAFDPPVAGRAWWAAPNALHFQPGQPWPTNTRVTARLAPQTSLAGRLFPGRSLAFRANPPGLAWLGKHAENPAERRLTLRAKLNQPLDEPGFRAALRLSEEESGATVAYTAQPLTTNLEYEVVTASVTGRAVRARFVAPTQPGESESLLWEGAFPVVEPMAIVRVHAEPERNGHAIRIEFTQTPAPGFDAFVAVAPTGVPVLASVTDRVARIHGCAAGETVRLLFKAGLPGLNGSVLEADQPVTLTLPDLAARLAFRERGAYLSSAGTGRLALETVNVQDLELDLWRVFPNNLVPLARETHLYREKTRRWQVPDLSSYGERVTNRTVTVAGEKNKPAATVLDWDALSGGAARDGVYFLVARDTGDRYRQAAKLLVFSDIGLSVLRQAREAAFWAVSIRDGVPLAGVDLTLYSRQNQLLGTARTDESGLARLTWAGDAEPVLAIAERAGQAAMLLLAQAETMGPRMEAGRAYLSEGYEAFLYADRGIYRPGEKAHVKALVRGPGLACPDAFPVQLAVKRPDGLTVARLTAMLSDAGSAEFEMPFSVEAPTGRYGLELERPGGGPAWGRLSVQVEDFVPPTLAVTVTGPAARVQAGAPVQIAVEARHLFGSPAGNRPVTMRARIGPAPFRPAEWPDFVFGDSRRSQIWRVVELGAQRLDEAGKAIFNLPWPEGLKPAAALICDLAATVLEDSGRACVAQAAFQADPVPFYIGLKTGPRGWREGDPILFEAAAVQPDGRAAEDLDLHWQVNRVTWEWYEEEDSNGDVRYRWERVATPTDGAGTTRFAGTAVPVQPAGLEPGSYEIEVRDGAGRTAAYDAFYVSGAEWGDWADDGGMRRPDRVEIRSARERLAADGEAVLTLIAPFPGKIWVTLESDRVLWSQVVDATNREAEVRFPVPPAYWPNVYVRAVAVRPRTPGAPGGRTEILRAAGVRMLPVDRPDTEYRVELTAPETIRPLSPLWAAVRVTDAAGQGVSAELTVAAVDEGILFLTGYRTPRPGAWFAAPRNLNAWLSDVYAWLIPETAEAPGAGRLRTGGDVLGGELAGRLNPIRARRFVPTALWSGTVRTDAAGAARVKLDVPEFSGQLRVTAVAAGRGGFGAAERAVRVRRDWVVQSSLPRAAASGDRFDLTCSVFNESGVAGEILLDVSVSGAARLEAGRSPVERVTLPTGGSGVVRFPMRGDDAGVAGVTVRVRAPGETWEERIELPVRPAWPRITRIGGGVIYPGRTVKLESDANWLPGTIQARLIVSGMPGLDNLGALTFLQNYPYGCLEQTVSSGYPFLAAETLAAAAGQGFVSREWAAARVTSAVRRVLTMQTADGAFEMWPRSGLVYEWGTAYTLQFLADAAEAGYTVPRENMDRACAFLERRVSGWLRDLPGNGQAPALAAAAHAMAAAGRPDHALLSRLLREAPDWDGDTQARLALALLAADRRAEAAVVLNRLADGAFPGPAREHGGSLRSPTRFMALALDGWLRLDPANPAVPLLADRLLKARQGGHWGTTQDNAAALLALARYARDRAADRGKGVRAQLDDAGGRLGEVFEAGNMPLPGPDKLQGLVLRNIGDGSLHYAWLVSGVPRDGAPDADQGVRIRRTVWRADGRPWDGGAVRQGELLVVKLTLDGMLMPLDNLVIEELLPAGLEIENPDLRGALTHFLPPDGNRLTPRFLTVRDDRLVAFTGDVRNGAVLGYGVRAVTPGDYVWPPAFAECMYDPAIRSLNGAGSVRVEP